MINPITLGRRIWVYGFIILGLCSCATPYNIEVRQKAVEERPEDFSTHLELARAYLERGIRWEAAPKVGAPVMVSKRWLREAKNELKKAMELDSLAAEPHYWMKVVHTAKGEYEFADKEVEIFNRLTARQKRVQSK